MRLPGLWLLPAAAGLLWLKLWLVSAQPILAFGLAAHDDRLFVNLAHGLLHGQWLGQFDQFTLAKGCFYPMWIALMARLGIPLLLSQHLLYLGAVLTIIAAVRPLGYRPWQLLLLAALLWLNPATYATPVLRVVREGIYPALTLFVVAGTLGMLCRLHLGSWRVLWRWVLVTGLALGAFWQTREEGPWLLPLVGLVMVFAVARPWRLGGWRRWRPAVACAIPLLAIPASDGLIALKNRAVYGIPVVVELRDHDFMAACGALTRVKPKQALPHVFVSTETRERIYGVSPAFATLRPFLEGPHGQAWNEIARKLWPDLPAGELGGGWFVWALRAAVSQQGNYASGPKAMAFYRRLASEVDGACREGRLDCRRARASMTPPWAPGYTKALFNVLIGAISYVAKLEGLAADPAPSTGTPQSLEVFRELTHDRLAPLGSLSDLRVGGWVLARPGAIISLLDQDGAPINPPVAWRASPDVARAFAARLSEFPHAGQARFDLVVPQGTSLVVKTAGAATRVLPLDGTVLSLTGPEVYFTLDLITYAASGPSQRAAVKLGMLNGIVKGYQWMMPLLAVLAMVSFLVQSVRAARKRQASDAWVIEAGLLAVLMARLVLLSLIEVTSFPAINPLYLAAAYPLLILFAFVGFLDTVALVSARWSRVAAIAGRLRSS